MRNYKPVVLGSVVGLLVGISLSLIVFYYWKRKVSASLVSLKSNFEKDSSSKELELISLKRTLNKLHKERELEELLAQNFPQPNDENEE
jgi:hypothetical protein